MMLKSKTSVLCLTLLLLLALTTTASAYVVFAKWNYNGTALNISYKWDSSVNSDWIYAWNTGISDWNGKPTKVDVYYSSTSSNPLGCYYKAGGVYGITNLALDSNWKIVGFNGWGNTYYTGATINRSTAGHEIGHVEGLDENPFYSPSIMNPYRDRSIIYTPQTDDVLGINYMYP
ncbi:MAG: hypothetical protein ACYC21_10000 [Eubacteriales bacterium]